MATTAGMTTIDPHGSKWRQLICAGLAELEKIGAAFMDRVTQRMQQGLQQPGLRVDAKRQTRLFDRAAFLMRRIVAFGLWLQAGRVPDEDQIARRAARLHGRHAGRDAMPDDDADEAADRRAASAAARLAARAARRAARLGRRQSGDAIADEQALFEKWFACRTTEEVITEFQTELVALARELRQQIEIVTIDHHVNRMLTVLDAVHDAMLELRDGVGPHEPLPFVAQLKAEHAALMRDMGKA
jgi:hypothetical protein